MRTAITGGTVVTAIETVLADVLIEGEIVVGVVHPDSEMTRTFAEGADRVIDAQGSLLCQAALMLIRIYRRLAR